MIIQDYPILSDQADFELFDSVLVGGALTIQEKINGWYRDKANNVFHFVDGNIQSENDEPAIIWDCGKKEWYFKGLRHRLNGFAYISEDATSYYFMGHCVSQKILDDLPKNEFGLLHSNELYKIEKSGYFFYQGQIFFEKEKEEYNKFILTTHLKQISTDKKVII